MLNTVEKIITWGDQTGVHFSANVSNHYGGDWLLTITEYDKKKEQAQIYLEYPTEDQAIRAAEALAGLPPKTPTPIIVQKEPYKIAPLGPARFGNPNPWNPKITC
jgi:hypothetical protein